MEETCGEAPETMAGEENAEEIASIKEDEQ